MKKSMKLMICSLLAVAFLTPLISVSRGGGHHGGGFHGGHGAHGYHDGHGYGGYGYGGWGYGAGAAALTGLAAGAVLASEADEPYEEYSEPYEEYDEDEYQD